MSEQQEQQEQQEPQEPQEPQRASDGERAAAATRLTKRCTTCGRFREYESGDAYCLVCGNQPLEPYCVCGRSYDYALAEDGDLHCPRCGRTLRGRSGEFEP